MARRPWQGCGDCAEPVGEGSSPLFRRPSLLNAAAPTVSTRQAALPRVKRGPKTISDFSGIPSMAPGAGVGTASVRPACRSSPVGAWAHYPMTRDTREPARNSKALEAPDSRRAADSNRPAVDSRAGKRMVPTRVRRGRGQHPATSHYNSPDHNNRRNGYARRRTSHPPGSDTRHRANHCLGGLGLRHANCPHHRVVPRGRDVARRSGRRPEDRSLREHRSSGGGVWDGKSCTTSEADLSPRDSQSALSLG